MLVKELWIIVICLWILFIYNWQLWTAVPLKGIKVSTLTLNSLFFCTYVKDYFRNALFRSYHEIVILMTHTYMSHLVHLALVPKVVCSNPWSHYLRWKLPILKGVLIWNLFIFMLQIWISNSSRHFKDLKLNIGLFWSLLAAKDKFKFVLQYIQAFPYQFGLVTISGFWEHTNVTLKKILAR